MGRGYCKNFLFLRHCKPRLWATLRRTCRSCSAAKVRCDRTRPACARCRAKHLPCGYPAGSSSRFPSARLRSIARALKGRGVGHAEDHDPLAPNSAQDIDRNFILGEGNLNLLAPMKATDLRDSLMERRTILCVYVLEDLYNYDYNEPTCLADELAPTLAPASRMLWKATTKDLSSLAMAVTSTSGREGSTS